jgi:hypothetical protein
MKGMILEISPEIYRKKILVRLLKITLMVLQRKYFSFGIKDYFKQIYPLQFLKEF